MRRKHFTREQFIKALEAVGFELVEETKLSSVYMFGQTVRVVIDCWNGVRIQYWHEKDFFFTESFWSELAHTANIDDVSQLPCDDKVYGRCFITSWVSPNGNPRNRVYYI